MNYIYNRSFHSNIDKLQDLINEEIELQKDNHISKKYLLLSSVGKHSYHQVCKWNYPSKNYDLFLIYYEPDEKKDELYYKQNSDFYLHLYGKKMIHYYYIFQLNLINKYDYIFILDNDNKISGTDISKLFRLATKLNANLLAPSIRIPDISHKNVMKVVKFYYNNFDKVNGNFWQLDKYLPNNLVRFWKHITKYTFWVHTIQTAPLNKRYIKCTNLVEDGRYIINRKILDKFRKNTDLMKQFKSGIMFDQLLAQFSNFKNIFICDFIYYQHMVPYANKKTERLESKEIVKYINKHDILKRQFIDIWPKKIIVKVFELTKYDHNKTPCDFLDYYINHIL